MSNLVESKGLKYIDLNLKDKVKFYYGINILSYFKDIIKMYSYDRIYFISEKNIFNIHGKHFIDMLNINNINNELLLINSTEKDKTFSNLEHISNYLISHKISKDSIIVSFGGGIVGNISGLAAGLIYRGVRYIEIPTTFMGQTDSSLSNKQAVNGHSGKNQIGMYYAPLFIWADLEYVRTENARNIKAALVEGFKNILIQDVSLLDSYVSYIRNLNDFTIAELHFLFETIIKSKNRILYKDPTEKMYGMILEYGHTFGHAIEFLTTGEIIHGEAVAIGMCIAAEISLKLNMLNKNDVELHYSVYDNLIFRNNPHIMLIDKIASNDILKSIESDNKRTGKGVKYVILEKIGKCANTEGDCQIEVDKNIIIDSINKTFSKIKERNDLKIKLNIYSIN